MVLNAFIYLALLAMALLLMAGAWFYGLRGRRFSSLLRRLRELAPTNFFPSHAWKDARKLHVVSFYTEGPPFDKGMDLRGALENLRGLVAPHVDSFTAFCPRTLRDLPGADRVCKEYPDAPLARNKNAEFLGYFDFKPFMLLHMLSHVAEGDLVLYHDCNLGKYKNYVEQGFSSWRHLCKSLLAQVGADLFVPFEHPNLKVHMHVKMHTMRSLLPTSELVKACSERPLINASRILVQKTRTAEEFLREWLELATQPHLVGPKPNNDPHPGFMWNCGDQDVLNVLVYAWIFVKQRLPPGFPKYYLRNRQLKRSAIKKMPGLV